MQERRVGRDSSRSHPDYQPENHAASNIGDRQSGEGTSDTSAGDNSRKYHEAASWR